MHNFDFVGRARARVFVRFRCATATLFRGDTDRSCAISAFFDIPNRSACCVLRFFSLSFKYFPRDTWKSLRDGEPNIVSSSFEGLEALATLDFLEVLLRLLVIAVGF